MAQANLITKTDFDAKLSSLIRNITADKARHLLIENELKKLKAFDSVYFRGKNHFENNGTQNVFVFQPIYSYFKTVNAINDNILSCKSKWLSDQSVKAPTTTTNFLNPSLNYVGSKIRTRFTEIV